MRTMLMPTCGYIRSTKHGMKSVIVIGRKAWKETGPLATKRILGTIGGDGGYGNLAVGLPGWSSPSHQAGRHSQPAFAEATADRVWLRDHL
jgi:hypothetical protein